MRAGKNDDASPLAWTFAATVVSPPDPSAARTLMFTFVDIAALPC